MKLQTVLKGAAAPIALTVAIAAQPAFAQEAAEEPVVTTTEADAEGDEGTIFVTGSRIRRDEFTSPAPLTVVNPETAVRQGLLTTADMVQGSPIAAGSSQITAAISSNFLTNGGIGAQTISLRGLGARRTLVLLNGRRAGPAGTRGAIDAFDLNVLPLSIMESVDILKDGASSIYGSDAVAGVVNLITKTDTDGVEFDFFGSVPQETGGEEWSASATWGKSFDRGHILASVNYHRRNELSRGDRSYLGCPENYVFTDTTFQTRADLIDPRTGTYSCAGHSGNTWGHVWTYDYTYMDNRPDANDLADFGTPGGSNIPGSAGTGDVTLFQYSYGNDNLGRYLPSVVRSLTGHIGVPTGWYALDNTSRTAESLQNNWHPHMATDTVIPETNIYTAYLDAAYELTDGIEFYTELLWSKRDNFVNASGQIYQFGYGEIYDYYYDYDDDGLQLTDVEGGFGFDPNAAGWVGAALFSPTGFSQYADSSIEVEYTRALAGFRGDISSNWAYDIYAQYSRSDGTYRDQTALKDAINTANFRNAINAPNGYRTGRCPNGRTPTSQRQCVFVDWFSPRVMYGDLNQSEYDFLIDWDEGNTLYTQKYVEAIVTGDLIDLWAGTVGLAAGATIREDSINDVPGAIRQADNGFNFGGAGITAGKSVTKEAFGEISVPLLADFPLAQRLDFTGAARVTNVTATRASDGLQDTDNGNWTYKLGLDWEVNDWLRFRGTYGTSFRSPALFELFLADQTGSLAQRRVDPCIQWGINLAQGNISQRFADNCAAAGVPANHTGSGVSVAIVSGGGIGVLDPETSRAYTASMILTPQLSFLPDTQLSIAVEYFNIEVNGEIAQLGAGNILASCYASDFYPNEPLCNQFYRFSDLIALGPNDPLYQQYFQNGSAANVGVVFDQFFNVNSQKNRGIDVTTRIVHDFAGDTTLTLQGLMTWQLHDSIALFDGLEEDLNGESGEPKWVGDFNAQLDTGPWSFFYNIDVVGPTDDTRDYLDSNGTLCPSFVTLGTVCLKLTQPMTFYHSASITREFAEHFRITAGVSNLFDTRPPRTSDFSGNADGIDQLGLGSIDSQYDLLGRRFFVNFNVIY